MIKSAAITSINFYQIIISVSLKNILGVSGLCRFEESCSEFTKRSIKEKGVIAGSVLGIKRIVSCQPFSN